MGKGSLDFAMITLEASISTTYMSQMWMRPLRLCLFEIRSDS
jgi:hypothetical protein